MRSRKMALSLNGNVVSEDAGKIHAQSDGLYHGAGCFETFKSYSGTFLRFDEHLNRLNRGIEYLTHSHAEPLNSSVIREEISDLIQSNNLSGSDAKIRIQVSIAGTNGYSVREPVQLNRVITADVYNRSASPRNLVTSSVTVVPNTSVPSDLKLSNMLHYRQAAIEAKARGADDALMLTTDGYVAETSIANLFWVTGDTVHTPSIECDILPGVMRNIVINLLEEMGLKTEQGKYQPDSILDSDFIWCTNSLMECVPVRKIDDLDFDSKSGLFTELSRELKNYKRNALQ
ncbi:aminotransferase class IV [Rhodohalobacter sp. SW132]|uniref:aminotransferase class IV n=1 Tax=Rhodohalobacter sp. SW132 TaxID=2293433 RepID=UPI00131501E7|nr:aminotransferase class IV [Rhodohalobacter sp. SW132]